MTILDRVQRNLRLLRESVALRSPQLPAIPLGNVLPVEKWETFASKIPEQEVGKFRVKRKLMPKGGSLSMDEIMGYDFALFLRDTWITVLEEHGFIEACKWHVWMSDSPMEYYGMWELNARTKPSKVLIGGLGLGVLTNIVANRKDISKVTVVEISPTIIEMIKPHVPSWVEIVQGDFVDYLHRAWLNHVEFDTIIVDIFSGNRFKDTPLLEDLQMEAEDYLMDYPDSKVLYWYYQRDKESELIAHWAIREMGK